MGPHYHDDMSILLQESLMVGPHLRGPIYGNMSIIKILKRSSNQSKTLKVWPCLPL